jgi:hypothetical protein
VPPPGLNEPLEPRNQRLLTGQGSWPVNGHCATDESHEIIGWKKVKVEGCVRVPYGSNPSDAWPGFSPPAPSWGRCPLQHEKRKVHTLVNTSVVKAVFRVAAGGCGCRFAGVRPDGRDNQKARRKSEWRHRHGHAVSQKVFEVRSGESVRDGRQTAEEAPGSGKGP